MMFFEMGCFSKYHNNTDANKHNKLKQALSEKKICAKVL